VLVKHDENFFKQKLWWGRQWRPTSSEKSLGEGVKLEMVILSRVIVTVRYTTSNPAYCSPTATLSSRHHGNWPLARARYTGYYTNIPTHAQSMRIRSIGIFN
jgi:hypothetical protein